jgi:hypothetical protein
LQRSGHWLERGAKKRCDSFSETLRGEREAVVWDVSSDKWKRHLELRKMRQVDRRRQKSDGLLYPNSRRLKLEARHM